MSYDVGTVHYRSHRYTTSVAQQDGTSTGSAPGPSGVVACVLPLCASSLLTASGARAATRARGTTFGGVLRATDPCHSSGKNEPTMDDVRAALLPITTGFRLRAKKA